MKSDCLNNRTITAESVHARFEQWRKTRRKREAIPDTLWSAAIGLTEQHGIHQVAKLLKLNYAGLKQRANIPSPLIRSHIKTSSFIEIPSMPTSNVGHCRVSIKRADGSQMQIQLTQAGAAELSSLVHAFLG